MAKKYSNDTYRNANASPLKEAIESMLKAYRIDYKFNETLLITNWEQIMGKTIANRTGKIFIRSKVLYAEITSSALKQDLNMSKAKMIALLNEAAKVEVINDIVFL